MSSVFARQLDSDGLSRRWFAAFAGAVRLIRLPCGKLRHPASAAASRQSVDLFFVGARHDAAFVRFRYLQYLDGFVGWYNTGLGVTLWFFACSATGAASFVAFLFGRRIVPLALFAKKRRNPWSGRARTRSWRASIYHHQPRRCNCCISCRTDWAI